MTNTADEDTAEDGRWMRRALHLARLGRTHPNPMVGAVIVADGRIVGEGYHHGVGTPHAETVAFAVAGDAARGATIYVTLEPCAHTVGANGEPRIPCAARCIAAGVRRVVAAMEDPDSRVAGSGFRRLREAGIEVVVGVEEARARALNAAYSHHRRTGLPYITHKTAMTLDGKIALPGGDSQWVTGAASRLYAHRRRDRADALVVGIGTVLYDDPSLTTRLPDGNGHDPFRVVIDSGLRTPTTAKIARSGTLVIAAEGAADAQRQRALEDVGVEVVVAPADSEGRVEVTWVARHLAERGLLDVLLESGGGLAASFWDAGLVCRALYFIAPKIVGGEKSMTPIGGRGRDYMRDARILGKVTIRRFGPDVALEVAAEE